MANPGDLDLRVHEVRPVREDRKANVVNQGNPEHQEAMDDQDLKDHAVNQDHLDQVDNLELRVKEENEESQAYR